MANLGTERLKIVNDQPSVTKLWNDRYRLEFYLDNDGKKEDWYAGNIGNILPAFGTLQAEQFGIGNWSPRDDEAYDNMRCISANTEYIPSANKHYVKLVYETLGDAFVSEEDDTTDYALSGLKRITRPLIAKSGVSYSKTVGATVEGGLYLGAYKIEDTDAYRRVEEVWMEEGTLSKTEDLVGSQKSIVIESIGVDPTTPNDYSLASKQESEYQGLQTNRFTFLKDDVELSRSDDLVGSQKAIVIEQFNGTPVTPVDYVLANTQISEVDGIPTRRYTFLKPSVLSRTEDKVGSQVAIVVEAFSETPLTPSGYELANTQESDIEGIPTRRYTFLKSNVTLSQSDDLVGSQKAIVIEQFDGTPATPSGYALASTQVSDVDGIPTKRYTFLKSNVTLSKSEDLVGSQLATVIEQFDGVPSTPSGYSIANKQESDVDGIKTNRYTFLKDDVELSRSSDLVGSQKSITIEQFNGTPVTPSGYSIASTQASDVEGIPTKRYTFLKDNVELSKSEDKVGSQLSITTEVFKPTGDPVMVGYSIARKDSSEVDGIPTERFTLLKDGAILSVDQDRVGSQLSVTNEVFNPAVEAFTGVDISGVALSGYSEASRQKSDVEGIPTIRYTFLKSNVTLSESKDNVGSQLAIVVEQFDGTPNTPDDYSLANEQVSDFEGISTRRYTFLKDNVELSRSDDLVGSQKAIVIEQFNGTPTEPTGYSIASTQLSDTGGIPTKRYTFLKDDVKLSESEDKIGSQLAISQQWFNPDADKTLANYSLASKSTSDFQGIKTVEFRFLKDDAELSRSEDFVGSQLSITTEVFKPSAPVEIADYSLSRSEVSDVAGIPTSRLTFLKNNVTLSVSEDRVGSQLAVVNEVFNPDADSITGVDVAGVSLVDYSEANRQKSDFNGIPTIRYTFLKDDVQLSSSEDNVGSQLAITEEWFKPETTRESKADYSLARTDVSDVDGIPTKRFTFLKDGAILSVSQDNVESQLSVTNEVFNPATESITGVDVNGVELVDYSEASRQKSNFNGIPTFRYTFIKAGIISTKEDNGPQGLPNTKTRQYVSLIHEPTNAGAGTGTYNGILLSKLIDNLGGLPMYTYTYLEGDTAGSNPTGEGTLLQTYNKYIEVRKAGELSATTVSAPPGASGATAVLSVVPPSIKKISATITIDLVTSSTLDATPAFNLSEVSASAAITTTRRSPVGVEQGTNLSVSVFNVRVNSETRSYPNHFFNTPASVSGTITSPSHIVRDDDSIIGEALDETTSTNINFTGSGTAPVETGIYQQDVEPVFVDAGGNQYYRKTTYTV